MRSRVLAVVAIALGGGALVWEHRAAAEEATMSFAITSPAFGEGQPIPPMYTCDGRDISPPLAWTNPPAGTMSLALISDDPDAPGTPWVHWVVYNISPSVAQLPEVVPPDEELPNGMRQGMTDFGRVGYGGPCPPSGTHRYFFTLYALDATLSLAPGATKRQLEQAMHAHVLAQAQVMGTYRRSR